MTQQKMVGTGWKTLSKIQNGDSTAILELTNDSHVIPCDEYGEKGNYDGCETTANFYIGNVLSNSERTQIRVGKGIEDHEWDPVRGRLKINNMSADDAYVDFIRSYNGVEYSARFSVSKTRNGSNSFLMDLTNDNHTFSSDARGHIDRDVEITTNVLMYKGTKPHKIESLSFSSIPAGMRCVAVGTDTVRITAVTGTELPLGGTIDIKATVKDKVDQGTKTITLTKTFSWSKIKSGNGIDTVVEYYKKSMNEVGEFAPPVSNPTDNGWSTKIPTLDAKYRYLWNYERVEYTGQVPKHTEPALIGMFSEDGRGITSIENYYLVSKSYTAEGLIPFSRENIGTGIPSDTGKKWTTKIQLITPELKYLWNIEKITYSKGQPAVVETEPAIIGAYGEAGKDGLNGAAGIDGQNGTSIIWQGTHAAHPSSPKNGWAYYNSKEKKSYVYQDGTWYQMTIDGINGKNGNDGLSIVWKGELKSAPPNPEKNWCYRDTDNGRIYIYNGNSWELMVVDGTNGSDGAKGDNGLSVYITYHDVEFKPSRPTGDGTSSGWHTDATTSAIWMSQKVASSPTSGTWGEPIKIQGKDGINGSSFIYATPVRPIVYGLQTWQSLASNPGSRWGSDTISNCTHFKRGDSVAIPGLIGDKGRIGIILLGEIVNANPSEIYVSGRSLIESGADGKPGPPGPAGPNLDWVKEWDGQYVEVGKQKIVSPRIFAGSVDSGIPTGVAIGRNIFGSYSSDTGIAGYKNGNKTFHVDVQGNVVIGNPAQGTNYVQYDGRSLKVVTNQLYLSSNKTIQDQIQEDIKKIEVGGRNYFNKAVSGGSNTGVPPEGDVVMLKTGNVDTYFYIHLHEPMIAGETYTLSCDVSFWTSGEWVFGIQAQNSPNKLVVNKNGRIHSTFVASGSYSLDEFIIDDSSRPVISSPMMLSNFKLEKGNKPTDWTPAPESFPDKEYINSEISNVNGQITAQANRVNGLSGKVEEALLKLSPEKIVMAVSEGLGKGSAISTTKLTLSRHGLYVDNGGFYIRDSGGRTTFYITSDGSLSANSGKVKMGNDGITVNSGNFSIQKSGNTVFNADQYGNLTLRGNISLGGSVHSSATIKGGFLESSNGDMLYNLNGGYVYSREGGNNVGRMGKNSVYNSNFKGITLDAERRCYAALTSKTAEDPSSFIIGLLVTGDYQVINGTKYCNGINMMRDSYFHANSMWEVNYITFDDSKESHFSSMWNWVGRVQYGSLVELGLFSDENLCLGHSDGGKYYVDMVVNRNTTRLYSNLDLRGRDIVGANAVLNNLQLAEPSPLSPLDDDGNPTTHNFNLVKTTQNLTEYIGTVDIESDVETYVPLEVSVFHNKYMVLLSPIGENKKVSLTRKTEEGFYLKGDACTVDYNIKFINEMGMYGNTIIPEEAPEVKAMEGNTKAVKAY